MRMGTAGTGGTTGRRWMKRNSGIPWKARREARTMAELQLTAEQRMVVEDRGGSLLVSAAAGSGKTKVLTERLMA